MNPDSLESLFALFRRDADAGALPAAFDRTAPELGRVASYLAGGDVHRAGDLLQATWLVAMTRANTWDEQRPLMPWLLGDEAGAAAARAKADAVPKR